MAIYHLSVKAVQRSKGRSATAAAAYRAAELIDDKRQGITHDYRKKDGVEYKEIFTPDDITIDRSELWNKAELAEKRKDGCTAREYEIALPVELNKEQRIALAREFAKNICLEYGNAVDLCIHAPSKDGDERNHHAHILTTTRKINNGELGEKCDIEKAGRKRKNDLLEVRNQWELVANKHLERAKTNKRITRKSHKDLGLPQAPTVKLGKMATQLERRNIESERGNENRRILALNGDISALKSEWVLSIIKSPENAKYSDLERFKAVFELGVARYQKEYDKNYDQFYKKALIERTNLAIEHLDKTKAKLLRQREQHTKDTPIIPWGSKAKAWEAKDQAFADQLNECDQRKTHLQKNGLRLNQSDEHELFLEVHQVTRHHLGKKTEFHDQCQKALKTIHEHELKQQAELRKQQPQIQSKSREKGRSR